MSEWGPRRLKDLLGDLEGLKALKEASDQRNRWLRGARALLPGELADHLVGANREGDTLVLVFDSPAWAGRAKYLQDSLLRAAGDSGIRGLKVRVNPARA